MSMGPHHRRTLDLGVLFLIGVAAILIVAWVATR